jgi:FkbM family methyltransferase
MKADSLPARIVCTPAMQSLYARVRQVPLLGGFFHKLARAVLPSGTRVTTRVREGQGTGLLLSLDPRYEAPYAAGLHEGGLLDCLAAHLAQGDVLYDVGGHIGFISMVGARLVGPKGSVFAFEADPQNIARILTHIQLNSLPQIEVVPNAVWSECKALSFRRATVFSSRITGSVANEIESAGAGVHDALITVEAVTLDRFALGNRPPTVVKIDVEGAEEEVLKGAETMFRVSKPVLICEIHHAAAAESVTAWLGSMGYRWKWMDTEDRFPRHVIAQANP